MTMREVTISVRDGTTIAAAIAMATIGCVRQRLRWALAALGKFLSSSILAYHPIIGAEPPDRCRSRHGAAKSLSESSTAPSSTRASEKT